MLRRNFLKKATVSYSFIQASYWTSFCIAATFAAVYLKYVGYTNTQVGIIAAAGNLFGIVLGPFLAYLIDKYENITPSKVIPCILILQTISVFALLVFPTKGTLNSIAFVLYNVFCVAANSAILKIYVDLEHNNIRVNYGLARGMGSLAFVALSFALSFIIEKWSESALPYVGICLCFAQIASQINVNIRFLKKVKETKSDKKQATPLLRFISENKRFFVLLIGFSVLFFAQNTIYNFSINMANYLGRGADVVGIFNGMKAAVEIPVLVFFSVIFKKVKSGKLLLISAIFFFVKQISLAIVPNVEAFYATTLLQAPSFAILSGAIVPYTNEVVPYKDSAKAQGMAFAAIQVGSIAAGLIGGTMYDCLPVSSILWIMVGISAIGMIICFAGVQSNKKTI